MLIICRKEEDILRVTLSVILFAIFLKMDSILRMVDIFVERGWSLSTILIISVLIRMVFGALVVFIILPIILGFNYQRDWLTKFLRFDGKVVFLGLVSFIGFSFLAAGIALGFGIFEVNLSTLFSIPDLRPDPDVVGWGYLILALVPGIWEELAFRGLILSKLRNTSSTWVSITLSATFFALFHFSNLVSQPLATVIPGVIMAFFFGIGWGFMTVRSQSVIPSMISHYLIDSFGQIFLGVNNNNPALTTGFFLLLTLLFPIINVMLVKVIYKEIDQLVYGDNT